MSTWNNRIEEAQKQTLYEINGDMYRRIPYGMEPDVADIARQRPCHDCNVTQDQLHVPGCDMEVCPLCHHQAISCSCQESETDQEEQPTSQAEEPPPWWKFW